MDTDKKLGHLLHLVSRAHHNQANRVFGQIGLFRGQPPVLFELGKQDRITQCELAKRLELTQASLTNLLNRMEASGLITRQKEAADARFSWVYLTEFGKTTLIRAKELGDEMNQTAFAGFTPAEQEQMNSYLERIHRNIIG